jgi:hypothetical protein
MANPAARRMGVMKRAAVTLLVLLVCTVSPASADLGMTMTMSMNAGGMAINGQMGNMTMVTTVTALTTDPVADEVFALPAGYTRN